MRRLLGIPAFLSVILAGCAVAPVVGTPGPVTLAVNPPVVAPGALYTVTLSGCQPPFEGPGETVQFTIDEVSVGSAVCGNDSTASAQLDAPDELGVHTVVGVSFNGRASDDLTVRLPVNIDLNPSMVEVGGQFTVVLVNCVGDDPDGPETVEFTVEGDSASEVCVSNGADPPSFSATADLMAPAGPGQYTVTGSSANGDASAPLTVLPPLALSLSPLAVEPGVPFTATVENCAVGAFMNFAVEGDSASTECIGGSASAELSAPGVPGAYDVEVTQAGSQRNASATLTVLELLDLSLSPSTVETGGAFTATLEGCTAGGSVDFSIESAGSVTTECVDGAASFELTAPDAPGQYDVGAVDTGSDRSASATLTVIPQPVLTVSPSTVETGGAFTATLEGCTADEPVQFTVEGASATDNCSGGAATAELTAPSEPGNYPVEAVLTDSGRTASAQLIVVAVDGRVVELDLAPATVDRGASFLATLAGCRAGEQVEFTVQGGSATAACDGTTARADLAAPSAPGVYRVEGLVTGSDLRDSADLTVLPPRDQENLVLPDPNVVVGDAFTATLHGCVDGEQVDFTVEGSSATASCQGSTASAELTAPSAPGIYRVDGVGASSEVTDFAELIVTGPPEDALVLSKTTVAPGEVFAVTLRGCVPGVDVVEFTVEGDSDTAECEEATSGPAGEARWILQAVDTAADGELTAPSEPGRYDVEALALTSGLRDTAVITVEALTGGPTPTTTPPTIPVTL